MRNFIVLMMMIALMPLASKASEAKKVDECILDSKGVCRFETTEVKEKQVKEKTPKVFKKSKIKRKLKDGSYQEFDGDNYKIVPRNQKRLQKAKVKKKIRPVLIREKKVPNNISHKNRISLVVAYGANGDLDCNSDSNGYRCETTQSLNLGIQGLRDFYSGDDMSVHGLIQIQTNKEISIGIGLGF